MRQQFVLPGYNPIRAPGSERLRSLLLIAATFLLAIWAGLGVGVLPPQMMVLPALPIVVMVPLLLWLAPDAEAYPERRVAQALVAAMILSTVWPRYLAFDLPGLPWITITRAAYLIFAMLLVYSLATSSRMRADVGTVLNYNKVIKYAFLTFLAAQFITTPLSGQMPVVSRFVNNLIYWSAMFLVSGHYFSKPGRLRAALPWLICLSAVLCVIGLLEFRVKHILWINYVHYFNIEADLLEHITNSENMRPGTDKYRTRSVFTTSLECAEYCALIVPFAWYYLLERRGLLTKGLALALIGCILVTVWATDSRLGMIGFVTTLLAYPLLFAIKRWRTNKSSMVGPALALAYPFGAISVGGALLASHSLAVAVLGGGQHQNSDDARWVQWAMGLRKLPMNPIGHGAGAGAAALGFYSPGGDLTVDSYYLTLLMDYGVIGAVSFLVFFATVATIGCLTYLRSPRGSESEIAGPIGLALLNFTVVKLVLSQESNHWLAFTLAGAVVGAGLLFRRGTAASG